MAWNPSPEVRGARDAAVAMGSIIGAPVNRCVVLYVIDDKQVGYATRVGYASFGTTPALCGQARRMADMAYESMLELHDDMVEAHLARRVNADGEPDWNGVLADVSTRLVLLREAARAENAGTEARRIIMRDLVMPAMELLGRFVACVNIEEPKP